MIRVGKTSRWLLFAPLFLVELYLIGTLILYQFGPISWPTENVALFWVLIFSYHIAFIIGYIVFAKHFKISHKSIGLSRKVTDLLLKYFWIFLIICTISSLINYRNLTKSTNFSLITLFEDFFSGLANPGLQYYLKFDYNSGVVYQGNKLITGVLGLSSFLFSSMIPICVFVWNRLKIGYKLYFAFLVFMQLATYIGIGTNKGIFDIVFLFSGSLFIDFCIHHQKGIREYLNAKKILLLVTAGLIAFSVWFFTYGLITRVGSVEEYVNRQTTTEPATQNDAAPHSENTSIIRKSVEAGVTGSFSQTNMIRLLSTQGGTVNITQNNREEALKDITNQNKQNSGGFLKSAFYGLTEYITQGYYGMSLALDEPFTSTYGIGNSAFLRSNFKSLFGIDVTSRTYQYKISDQWDADMKWHSFYSYMANDISFYGVIVLMFIIGAFLAITWKDAIWGRNLISQCILPLFVIMFLYMPANNQIFSVMQSCCAFLELTFLWALVRFIIFRMQRKEGST